jgi:AcrR family transcriptional regulator
MSEIKKKHRRVSGNRELQRRTVLETAAEIFSEKGFRGASMADVARALGVTRPALYYYFDSKEQILTSLVKEVTLYIQELGDSVEDETRDPAETLFEMVKNNALFIIRNPVLFRVVERCENDFRQSTKQLNTRGKRRIFEEFKATIVRGIRSGHFKDIDPSVAAFSVIGLCSWSAWWFKPEGRLKDTEVAAQIASMAVASVRDGQSCVGLDEVREQLQSAQLALNKSTRLLAHF